tara:strand:- start:534 stop:800 length:267 start_codon:yes stop_codon:yes gene_type:complete
MTNTFKNVPGPWVATATPDLSLFVCVDDESHTLVASLNFASIDDAKLIAAAPELLAACVEFIRKCESGEAKSTRSYAEMKRAVQKATT